MSGLFLKVFRSFLFKLFTSLATEKMISFAFFSVLEGIAKNTNNKTDDEWVAKIKAAYEESK